MPYRIDQLAATCGVSVDTVRYYQSRRLLPAPRREGRIAWYEEEHVARIARIRDLHSRGLTLAAVRRVVDGELDRADIDLAVAVATAQAPGSGPLLTLEEMAARCGMPAALLKGFLEAGLDLGRTVDGSVRFTEADVTMVRLGLSLLDVGLPLTDLLAIAQEHAAAMRRTAEQAVALFDAHVRRPLRSEGEADGEAADALVAAFESLLPAATELVAHHFRHVLLAVAEEHMAEVGTRPRSPPRAAPSGPGCN